MAPAVAALWAIEKPPLDWLVESFDRLLRLYNESPEDSYRVAATIEASSSSAAGTFREIVDALIAAAEPMQEPIGAT